MAIVVEGPSGLYEELGWDGYVAWLAAMLAAEADKSTGPSPQKAGSGGGENIAMKDQIAGKVGPMIGKWDPEKKARLMEEF